MPVIRVAILVAVIAAASSFGLAAQRGSAPDARGALAWPVRVEPIPLAVPPNSAQPQLTASSRGIILSWLESTPKTAVLKFAERTPNGWSAPRTVASGDDWFVNWADVPAVHRLADGRLVAYWFRKTHEFMAAYDLVLSHSSDEGRTWSAPFTPHHDNTRTQHGFVSLFDLPDGGVGVLWLDGRAAELKPDDPEGGATSLWYASFDRGWKQTGETEVDERVCDCCPLATAMTSAGLLAAYRDRDADEIRDISVARLENGRWSAPAVVHDDGWEVYSCPVNGPALSARGQQAAVAWFTAVNDQGRAYAAFSSDAGRTWGTPVRLDDSASTGHVDIELLDDGSAAATWIEFSAGRSELRLRRVDASGARSPAISLAAVGRATGIPRMARSGQDLVFAWTEGATDAQEDGTRVMTARAR